ncbi:MAG: hypothetical protein LBK12_00655 [Odoribacteraceae bacterium]|jgi:hypothetical protein|nr:hypothetical protein [Odoribacteraceae bacterium]
MSQQRTIPKKDIDFNVAQEIIVTTANANRAAWGLDAAWMDGELLPARAVWTAAWAAYENPATRTPAMTAAKTARRAAYEKLLRVLVKTLQSGTRVTGEELRGMGIVVPSSARTPSPVAATYPLFDVDSGTIRCLKVYFRDRGQGRSRGKPDGQRGAVIRWALLAAPPAALEGLVNAAFATRSPFVLDFDERERGKTVYFCLCWENTRGEQGPWSEIAGAFIP